MKLDEKLLQIVSNFDSKGTIFIEGSRNSIKLFDYNGFKINVKSFKKPNFFNKVIYTYFRKSKAKRSYDFAKKLQEFEIGTPEPIAYYENKVGFGIEDSYYISKHLQFDLMFRDLVENQNYPDIENILDQFMAFCYKLHQNGIEFLDHSPGNTLIVKEDNQYNFFLVDLNRMHFHESMSFDMRMKNLSRLTPHKEMIQKMSQYYAKYSGEDEVKVFEVLWEKTANFQERYYRKKRIKKRLKLSKD